MHDGNFVMDGMVLTDDVPTPSLHEFKAVAQPVRFAFDGDEVAITNLRHSADTSDLRFRWRVEHDGTPVDSGDLEVPVVAAGESARVPLPRIPVSPDAETWLTIDAVLAAGTAWAPDGHVIATAQLDRSARSSRARRPTPNRLAAERRNADARHRRVRRRLPRAPRRPRRGGPAAGTVPCPDRQR